LQTNVFRGEDIIQFCGKLLGVEETFPFDEKTLVWKVMNKMFCLGNVENFDSITVKCQPERALLLREEHPQIGPGYHMNNKHWITINLEGMDQPLVFELLQNSYQLVVQKLPVKQREQLKELTI